MLNLAAAFAEPVDGTDESKRPAAERVDDNQPKSTPALTGPVSDTDEDMPELVVELGLPAQNDSKPEKQPAKKTAAKKPAKQSVTAPTSKELAQAERRARLAREALSFRGTPYVWGGEGRGGFDCSGFTQYLYKKRGINLPHSAKLQFSKGKPVAKGQLMEGDLVFFNTTGPLTHVGMYIGNGKFVHAANKRRGVTVDLLDSPYYAKCYAGARRYTE